MFRIVKRQFSQINLIKNAPLKRINYPDQKTIQSWKLLHDKIQKIYKFQTFPQAFSFMSNIASLCDRCDHHPEWINVYNSVEVNLSTHDAQGLTMKDVYLAELCDTVYQRMENNRFQVQGLFDTQYSRDLQ